MNHDDYEGVHVILDNVDDLHITATQEIEPEHFIFTTLNIAPQGTAYADGSPSGFESISLDLQRKSIAMLNVGSVPVILCHSVAQVKDPANYATPIVSPQGGLIPAGGNWGADGTGPVWVVNTSLTVNALVTVTVNRRGNA
jgi:hypothetical protein